MTGDLRFVFEARLWEYQGDAPWVFVTLPMDQAEEITARVPERRGFGSVKVRVFLGGSVWMTSLFPDRESGSYVLPVKREIRRAERAQSGDIRQFEVEVLD